MNTQSGSLEHAISAGVKASVLEYLHACPICLNPYLGHYCRVPSLFNEGEFIHYERCAGCGTVIRNPRLLPDRREQKYEDGAVDKTQLEFKEENQVHYRYMARLLNRMMPSESGRRLLDFGCGAGGFLVEANQAGFDSMGLEINRTLARHVTEDLGIPTYQGKLPDPDFAKERFNIVISSQVFEHLVDPRATLVELKNHLIFPGFLLIELPNIRHIRERLHRGAEMDDSHLFYFSASSLSRMLNDCGFEVLKIQEGLRPYRILGQSFATLPDWAQDLGQGLLSLLQVKTGLSIVSRLA